MTRAYDVRKVETRWREAWEREGCHRAPELPRGEKFFNYDSGPFPNGPLHMGHVRTYLLGDVTARYQRSRGRSVLYCTEWDAFGLPNELEAIKAGVTPAEYSRHWIGRMTEQMLRLGLSYDRSRIPSTCDPAYYRWTQWWFLELLERGLVQRRRAELSWCSHCRTTLARMQVEKERCWRCGNRVLIRRQAQWYVTLSSYVPRLQRGLEDLDGWSDRAKRLVASYVARSAGPEGTRASRVDDWLVSRQRSWGTPVPIVFCRGCGPVPVPRERLPVRLPDDLDWAAQPTPLAACRAFVETECPRCGGFAQRDTDTLDCFFDDIWCFLACLAPLDDRFGFERPELRAWMPVDRFHSGLDTFIYLHLHRFLGAVMHEAGWLDSPEPIRSHLGHEMVLAGGRKMSKHLGNAISPRPVLNRHGADALRVAVLWAAAPQKALDWGPRPLEPALAFLDRVYVLFNELSAAGVRASAGGGEREASRSLLALRERCRETLARVGRFIEEYRPNAAVEALSVLLGRIESFALHRARSGRLGAGDSAALATLLLDFSVALAPFAPHLAEEVRRLLGEDSLAAGFPWPG